MNIIIHHNYQRTSAVINIIISFRITERFLFQYTYLLVNLVPMNCIAFRSLDGRVVCLPSTGRKDMFVSLIPPPLHHFARMGLILLNSSVIDESAHGTDIYTPLVRMLQ